MEKDLNLEKIRLKLHNKLLDIIASENLHYQPDSNIRLSYPCILYSFEGITPVYADNLVYLKLYVFEITLITEDATDDLFDTLGEQFIFEKQFEYDGLYHSVFKTTI